MYSLDMIQAADPAIAEEEGPMYDNDINVPWTFMDRNYLEMLLEHEEVED